MRAASVSLGLILALVRPAFADDKDKLLGTRKIVSAVVEDVQTKEQKPLYGEHPKGYLILLPTGRMMSLLISEGRKGAAVDQGYCAHRLAESRKPALVSNGGS